ncbi:hypothetical protein OG601_40760 [Streptomyces sp. NBC_01239]|uniref:hypothetical protein n=1 Tax=Streptomyces sp. NBC_01239 TaxID=2903792 RepID=UPI002253841F|nr:hypothetical protein [Streptomyces sp. NBC_01239]MCX4816929.1 hypothetical protein [Streptomyces sp. NBC_01239]
MSLGYDNHPVVARSAATTGLPGVPAAMADVPDAVAGWGTTRTALEQARALGPPGRGEGRYAPRFAVRLVDAVGGPRRRVGVGVGARDRGAFGLTVRQVPRHPVQTAVEPERSVRAGPGSVGLGSGGVPLRGSFAGLSEHSRRVAAPGLPRGPSDGVPAVPAPAVPPQPG